jgi:hypothetical protein
MPKRLKRIYGFGHLHFITFSCYHRLPLLGAARARNVFVQILNEVRDQFGFALVRRCNGNDAPVCARRMAQIAPSMFAGHDLSCPYEDKEKTAALKDAALQRQRHQSGAKESV